MNDEIGALIKQINNKETLPDLFLRRNSPRYAFVSCINNSIACFVSENYDAAMTFLARAYKERNKLNAETDYYRLCERYIKTATEYMVQEQLLNAFGMELADKMNP